MATTTGPTLTRIAFAGRLFVKYGIITLVVLIVGRTFLAASYSLYMYLNPPPPPAPTVGFGPLPQLNFPEQSSFEKPRQYRLETPNASLPLFPDRATVYLAKRTTLSLTGDQKAKQIASTYGYVFPPVVLSTSRYRWTKQTPLQANLEMNIENFHFMITSDYLSRPELLAKKDFPQSPADQVKSFLNNTVGYDRDIATASGKVTYLRANGTELTPAVSLSDADFISVDINRVPVDGKYPFYTADPSQGVIHAILTGGLPARDQIVQIVYNYQRLDYTQVHTYPLRNITLAWQALQAGEGYVANPGTGDTAVIRSVSLGYYDDIEEQDYAQPIYVFAGDNGFVGYVSAIDPAFIELNTSSTASSSSGLVPPRAP